MIQEQIREYYGLDNNGVTDKRKKFRKRWN